MASSAAPLSVSPGYRGLLMRILTYVIEAYFALSLLTFWASTFSSMTGLWPSRLQVPWSEVGSFVETKDGTLLVEATMWGRIQRFDQQGNFLGSWRRPFAKGQVELATDESGRIYLRHASDVFRLGPDGELAEKYSVPSSLPANWRLAENGRPQYASNFHGLLERKLVRKGQMLFADDSTRYFLAPGSTTIQATSHSLTRVSATGQLIKTYQGPGYFWPLLFPLPAALAWVAGLILIVIGSRQ